MYLKEEVVQMSYICGIIDIGAKQVSFDRLYDMSRAMKLRGGEMSGAYINRGCALCFGGGADSTREPYTIVRGGRAYIAVFDGEIYNSDRLASLLGRSHFKCPAEAALECYIAFGYECAALLEGVFAFAVYDEGQGEVYLARDALGARPLYYLREGIRVSFASEIKGLLRYVRDGIEVDRGALSELVLAPEISLDGTDLYRGINEIGAGCFAVCSALGIQVRKYKSRAPQDIFERWQTEQEAVTPRERMIGEGETIHLMSEMVAAFDYPRFDEYTVSYLGYLGDLRQKGATSAVIADRALRGERAYAFERADRLGHMRGVSVRIVPRSEELSLSRKTLAADEKKLSAEARKLLREGDSYIFRLFGARPLERVAAQRDLKARVRGYGLLIQSELWLANYPMIVVD